MSHASSEQQRPVVIGGTTTWEPEGGVQWTLWGGAAPVWPEALNAMDPNAVVWPQTTARDTVALAQVGPGPWAFDGPQERSVEDVLKMQKGIPDALAVANGSLALIVAVNVMMKRMQIARRWIPPVPEVIMPTGTFKATAQAVALCGCKPVFIDVDRHTGVPTVEAFAAAITENTVGLIPVVMYATATPLDDLKEVADELDLWVLLDAAHAPFGTWKGRPFEYFADIVTTSFQRGKVLTSGEGGAVTTRDPLSAALARMSVVGKVPQSLPTWWPARQVEGVKMPSLNLRWNEPQAALWLSQYELYAGQEERRAAQMGLVVTALRDGALPFRALEPDGGGISYKLGITNQSRVPTDALRFAVSRQLTAECTAPYTPLNRSDSGLDLDAAPWQFGRLGFKSDDRACPTAGDLHARLLMLSHDLFLRQDAAAQVLETLKLVTEYETELVRWAGGWSRNR